MWKLMEDNKYRRIGGEKVHDNELMLRVQNEDKEAFETLIKRYMKRAIAFACKYVHDTYAAEDIVQESFADIYIQRFQFDPNYKFSTYLFAIIKNKSLNYLKKNRELLMSGADENGEPSVLGEEMIHTVTPEMEYVRKEEFSELLLSIQKLEEEERTILYLYASEGCSYKEIAGKLGKTVMQIKIKLFRARKKLRERREG